jgi:hypothetical protein
MSDVTVISPVFSHQTFRDIASVMADGRLVQDNFDPKYFRHEHTTEVDRTTRVGSGYITPFMEPLVDVHLSLVEPASDLFGERLKPSFVFVSQYLVGGTVTPHLDRVGCDRTIDVLIAQDDDEPWPMLFSERISDAEREAAPRDPVAEDVIASHRWTEVVLKPNEGVCFSGTHQWHYRPTQATARTDLIFFYFIPED